MRSGRRTADDAPQTSHNSRRAADDADADSRRRTADNAQRRTADDAQRTRPMSDVNGSRGTAVHEPAGNGTVPDQQRCERTCADRTDWPPLSLRVCADHRVAIHDQQRPPEGHAQQHVDAHAPIMPAGVAKRSRRPHYVRGSTGRGDRRTRVSCALCAQRHVFSGRGRRRESRNGRAVEARADGYCRCGSYGVGEADEARTQHVGPGRGPRGRGRERPRDVTDTVYARRGCTALVRAHNGPGGRRSYDAFAYKGTGGWEHDVGTRSASREALRQKSVFRKK